MTGRFTAMSGFLTGLFSQSPNRVSSEQSSQDNTRASPNAGPSTFGNSPGHKGGLAILEDKPQTNDSVMYGVELDMSTLDAGSGLNPNGERSIASSGFYGTARTSSRTDDRRTRDKGKGRAKDVPLAKIPRRIMEDSFQPVRVYRCPASDRPLYTLDRVNHTVTIHATDADSRYWPSKAHQKSSATSDADHLLSSPSKKKDWHEPVNSETKQCLAWKQKCGQGLARLLELEGDPKSWKLADWPKGYKMFIKHQYQTQYSFFHYIIGSSFLCTKRFTTAKEYTKHLYWLCTFGEDIQAKCKCRFCVREHEKDGKSRTAIIQRCVRVPYSGDMPPPSKRAKYTASTSQKVGSANRNSLLEPVVEIPIPTTGASVPASLNAEETSEGKTPAVGPPSLASSALPLVNAAGGLFSKVFGYSSAPTISATILKPTSSTVQTQKKGGKGGRSAGAAGAGLSSRPEPVVEIASPAQANTSAITLEGVVSSVTMVADGSNLGKRKRRDVDYRMKTLAQLEAEEIAEAAHLAANTSLIGVDGNGRAARSTRNLKSMKESPVPPLRPPAGPMYNGPFIHRKRHDDLKIHSAPYREHEIVWYKLDNPHICPTNAKVQVTHWPAEIISKTLKIETHHVEIVPIEDMNGDKIDIPQPVNLQYYVYMIELMGVESGANTFECRVRDLLPWVTYSVPEVMRTQARMLLKRKDSLLKSLDGIEEDFQSVLTTWAWARHWADAIRSHFAPFGLFFDSEALKKMRRRKQGGYYNGSSKKKRSRAERDAKEKEMIRETEMIESSVQQYQGIWFGSEKIWVGDMVRLAGTFESSPSTFSKPSHQAQANGNGITTSNSAYLQLYKGRRLSEGKGPLVELEGFKMTEASIGKPAFLQVTHIYRVPGQEGTPATLDFDGTYYELVKEDEGRVRKPPSSNGGMQGVLDTSDTSSSSPDQDFIDPVTGVQKLDTSIPSLYRKELVPPPAGGYVFKPLKRLPGIAEEDGATGIPPHMIAGRYYTSDILFPDSEDQHTRKLTRSASGKTYRPETQMRPTHWIVNRRVMIRASRKVATKDMQIYFNRREEEERKVREHERRRQEVLLANGGNAVSDTDEDDGPVVSSTRVSQPDTGKDREERREKASKATTVTVDDGDESDTIVVATTKA